MGCGGTRCSQSKRLLKHQLVATRTSRAAVTGPLGGNRPHGQTKAACSPIDKRISATSCAMEHRMNKPRTGALQQRKRHRLDGPIEMPTASCNHNKGLSQT